MKINFSKLFIPFLGMSMLFTACSNETSEVNDNISKASLSISLSGNGLTRASKEVTQKDENAINKMIVLIFNKGTLEAKQEIKGTSGKVTGLITGAKQVNVIVNPSDETLTKLKKVTKFADFKNVTLDLEEEWNDKGEMNEKKGFAMTGFEDVTLKAGDDNKVEIKVSRVVAKVILGTVDVKLIEGFDESKFELTSVSMMKVRSKSLLGFTDYLLKSTGNHYSLMGGIDGKISTIKEPRLSGDIAKGANKTYFYVAPNDNTDDNCTLMTISAKYEGEDQQFAFRINDKEIKGHEELTGKYIEANHQYTLNVLIKRPFGTGPEDPQSPATLEVTVIPQDWVVVPTQNVEW